MKKVQSIPFLDIESIPLLVKDFLQKKVLDFEEEIFSVKNVEKHLHQKRKNFSREKRLGLYEVLKEQNSIFQLTAKQTGNLELLQDENTFTVTTGHQLNLFTGPVFFIYKILQTIKLAEFLNDQFPEDHMVPVFWMATEDHDFEEINHFKTENGYYESKAKSVGAVGKIIIEDDFFISELERDFKDTVFGTELVLMMKRAYKKGNTLSQATRILVQELFSEYGLLILDGDDANLKSAMVEVFEQELLHQELFETTKETVNLLSQKYGKVQVNPREINLFYLSDTRNRIEFDGEKYHLVEKNKSFTKEEILNELHLYPEKFSPNALMRPIYQETVLPNLAYVGGNAEVMYWLELKKYFEKLCLPFPVLIPRNSLLFMGEKILVKTKKLGLEIEDFYKNFAIVTKDVLMENNEILSLLDQNKENLKNSFKELVARAEETDKTFRNLVEAEQARQLKSFERMRKRLLRAEKIKQKEKLERLEQMFLKIHPGKNWQERVYNFSVFYADHGKEWLQNCYEEMNVENSELIIVSI